MFDLDFQDQPFSSDDLVLAYGRSFIANMLKSKKCPVGVHCTTWVELSWPNNSTSDFDFQGQLLANVKVR